MWASTQRDILREVAPGFAVREFLSNFLASKSNWSRFEMLVGESAFLQDFVKAAMVSQIYSYIGIRTVSPMDAGASFKREDDTTIKEKRDLFKEISIILNDNFQKDVLLLEKKTELELAMAKAKLDGKPSVEDIPKRYIVEVSSKFPTTHLIDFLGDLLGISYNFRSEFLKKTYGLKPLSLELEEEVKNPHEEECVEISTFIKVKDRLRELAGLNESPLNVKQLSYLSKEISSRIFSRLPKDQAELRTYIEACGLKLLLIGLFKKYTREKTSLENLFNEALRTLTSSIKDKSKNVLVLRRILSFLAGEERIERLGIDLSMLQAALSGETSSKDVLSKFKELGISKSDLSFMLERYKRLERVRSVLTEKVIPRLRGQGYSVHTVNLEMFTVPPSKLSKLEELIINEVKKHISPPPPEEFRELLENEASMRKILDTLGTTDINMLKVAVEFEVTLDNLVRQVMQALFFECLAHASRVVELYNRLKKDSERFKIFFKVVIEEPDVNIRCVKEEMLVELIIRRQMEIREAFPDLDTLKICSFIWARQAMIPMEKSVRILEETPSPLFASTVSAPLNFKSLPPVSYATAYDLAQRYISIQLEQAKTVKEARARMLEEEEKAKRRVYERLEPTSLLERKIKIALKAPSGIEKAELEWTQKDTQKIEAISKLFIRQEVGSRICPYCARKLRDDVCPEHGYVTPIVEGPLEALAHFYFLSLKTIEEALPQNAKRLRKPSSFSDALKTVKSIFSELKIKGKLSPKSSMKHVMEGDVDRYLIPAVAKEIAQAYMRSVSELRKLR
nr:hypothetical protein [Candidatus Bathyarchaeota archaeon]